MRDNGYRRRLQDSIDFIEANLKEELPLREVSLRANASLYHFHRLFRAFVGESLKEYVRHRRLTHAARDLVTTANTVINIALDYQYSTPESFLRAFKTMYRMTPRDFRKRGNPPSIHEKADLLGRHPGEKEGGIHVKPQISERSPFTLYGSLIHTRHSACKREVAGFWACVREDEKIGSTARAAGADSIYGVCFGVCEGCGAALEDGMEEFPYIIGWEGKKGSGLPDGMVEMTVAGGLYAVFIVEGDERNIQEAVNEIYGSWLPTSTYELSDSPVLEKYGMDWTGEPGSSMEIWLPIKRDRK